MRRGGRLWAVLPTNRPAPQQLTRRSTKRRTLTASRGRSPGSRQPYPRKSPGRPWTRLTLATQAWGRHGQGRRPAALHVPPPHQRQGRRAGGRPTGLSGPDAGQGSRAAEGAGAEAPEGGLRGAAGQEGGGGPRQTVPRPLGSSWLTGPRRAAPGMPTVPGDADVPGVQRQQEALLYLQR